MKLAPSYQLNILPEETFRQDMAVIEPQLASCRQEGTFTGHDGNSLFYEYFQVRESRGAVVVLHGLSEFTSKYHEFAWYLLNQGYDVFLYDQRGHGRSCRLTDRLDLIHVDAFTDYQKDLHCFISQVVRKVTSAPLYLYAHSMGGAVAVQYLAAHPQVFSKAVLSAPMIEPMTGGVPPFLARWGLSIFILLGQGKKKFWQSAEFDPEYPFARSHDKSFARFSRNMDIRLANPCYCTTPQSLRWIQQSLFLRHKLTRKRFLKKIQTPILMLRAEKDTVVNGDAQADFAKNCAVCRQVIMPDACHSMLLGTHETITDHVRQVLDHFC